MNELSISLSLADRSYRLVIDKEHEELFRKAAKLIDKRMKDYSGSYAYKDKQDLLAMVALEYATAFLQHDRALSDSGNQWEARLQAIDRALDEQLKTEAMNVL
ncbi:MAG TPA: cell division protein ZapA [Bacteroidales bacterium]|nr:cell division protein ZapA [Bacteroidales bacterium]HPS61788.1 cell division protein ZapA [Bacteroidales bacterium]